MFIYLKARNSRHVPKHAARFVKLEEGETNVT
jgi:hypothetical protein